MRPTVTLRAALADKNLLGGALDGDSWQRWRILLIAAAGEALIDDERVIYEELTHRDREPGEMCEQLAAVIGRKGGKTKAVATFATWIAGLCQHPALSRGETGTLLLIAQDQRTADVIFGYILSNFEASPILRQLVQSTTQRVIRLNNNIVVEVRAADFRNLRGLTFIAVVADEIAFFMTDGSNPDSEIITAIKPGLMTTRGPLIMISSPYARKGTLYEIFDRHFGSKGDRRIIVAQAASKVMNPELDQGYIDREYERDPSSASAELGALFRTDVESIFNLDQIRACTPVGVFECAPNSSNAYLAFVDPSGGQHDSMTLAVAHQDYGKEIVILDRLVEIRAPFSSEFACHEFAEVLKSYGLTTVFGDGYAKVWVVEQFARFGISYVSDGVAPKSQLYGALLSAINSRRVSLLDNERLVNQLVSLERATSRNGRDVIDHPPGAHDDVANCCAGAVAMILQQGVYNLAALAGEPDDPDGSGAWHAARLHNYIYSFAPRYGRVR